MYSRRQNRNARYHSALGSARETLDCLEVAEAFGYLGRSEAALRSALERVIGTLVKLVRGCRFSAKPRFDSLLHARGLST